MTYRLTIELNLLFTLVLGFFLLAPLAQAEDKPNPMDKEIMVYKTPTCGCCSAWVDYLKDNGFTIKTQDLARLDEVKTKYGVTPELASCHTAVIDGYVIEGHVPANDIIRLLTERPAVTGLSAPGMPSLSPGMGSIEPKDYDVLAFDAEGRSTVFSRY